jgi:hypothetical protein
VRFFATRILSVLLVVWMLLLFSACEGTERDWLFYRRESGTFLLEGNRNGKDFSCEVTRNEGQLVSVCYLSPDSLAGICITPTAEGRYRVERGDLATELSGEILSGGLLLPAELILLREATLLSVQRLSDGALLRLSAPCAAGEITVTMTEKGIPRAIASESVAVRVLPIGKEGRHENT